MSTSPFPSLPLDPFSSIIMIANVQTGDLLDVFGPFGGGFSDMGSLLSSPALLSPPRTARRLYCLEHLLLRIHRHSSANNLRDTSLVEWDEMMARAKLELWVREHTVKLFGVRRPSTKTWDQCPHCRWKERNLERLRQSYG